MTEAILDIIKDMMEEDPDDFIGAESGNAYFNEYTLECTFTWLNSTGLYRIELDYDFVLERLEELRGGD